MSVRLSWIVLIACLIAWPVTTFTVARDEPPFVLGLSWFAIIYTAWDVIMTSRVHENQKDDES